MKAKKNFRVKIIITILLFLIPVLFFYTNSQSMQSKMFFFELTIFGLLIYFAKFEIKNHHSATFEISLIPFLIFTLTLLVLSMVFDFIKISTASWYYFLIMYVFFINFDIFRKKHVLLLIIIASSILPITYLLTVKVIKYISPNYSLFEYTYLLIGKPVYISIFSTLILPAIIYFLSKKKYILLNVSALLINLASIVLYGNLVLWICVSLVLFIWLLIYSWNILTNKKVFAFTLTTLVLLIGTIVYLCLSDSTKFKQICEKTFCKRIYKMKVGFNIFKKYPTIGKGPGVTDKNFLSAQKRVTKKNTKLLKLWTEPNHTGNEYIETALMSGIIGFIFFLCFLVLIIRKWIIIILSNKKSTLNIYLFSSILLFLIISFFENTFSNPPCMLIFFTFAFYPLKKEDKVKFPSIYLLVPIILSSVFLFFGAKAFLSDTLTNRAKRLYTRRSNYQLSYIEKHYLYAIKTNDSNIEALKKLSLLYIKNKKYTQALYWLNKLNKINPAHSTDLLISKCLISLGKNQKAENILVRITKSNKYNIKAYIILSSLYVKQLKYPEAIKTVKASLLVAPNNNQMKQYYIKVKSDFKKNIYRYWLNKFFGN